MGDRRFQHEQPAIQERFLPEATSKLRDDAYRQLIGAGNDRLGSNKADAPKFDNPYRHSEIAITALRELDGLKDVAPGERISFKDANGFTRLIPVEQYRAMLLITIEKEFSAGINAADRIDQNRLSSTLITINDKLIRENRLVERKQLESSLFVLDAMKHAPSVLRVSYADFLLDQGELTRARKLLDEATERDVEARHNPYLAYTRQRLEAELRARETTITDERNPLVALNSAIEKRTAGDARGAESDFKKAIELAGKIDPKTVAENIKRLDDIKAFNSGNPAVLKALELNKQAWTAICNSGSIAAILYAEFLIEKTRYKEARDLLVNVGHNNQALVKGDKHFEELLQKARNEGKPPEKFDNPFVHLSEVQRLADKEDIEGVRNALEAAVKAADKIDRKLMQENQKELIAQLQQELNPEYRKSQRVLLDAYDQLDHAAAFTRICLARFEIANRNYDRAQALLAEVESADNAFTLRPSVKFAEVKEAAVEPSTWSKVWTATCGLCKELLCDGVSIAVGAGAAILTGWTGPGAIAVGGAAGAATYTGIKTLVFGEKLSWDMPLWGAIDGASGGAAALARTALTRVGGQIVTKEVAASLASKVGADLAKVTAKEGTMAYGKAVAEMGREGLKQLAHKEGLSRWTRMTSHIPLTGAVLGNTQYRAAINSMRGLVARNLAANALVDGGTVLAGSLVYRGIHSAADYSNGKYDNFGDFLSSYGRSVVFDTTKGAGVGCFATSFGYGALGSFGLNGSRELLLGNHKSTAEWLGNSTLGVASDMALGFAPHTLLNGRLGNWLDRGYLRPLVNIGKGGYIAGSPLFSEAAEANNHASIIESRLAEMQRKPADANEVQMRYFTLSPETEFPKLKNRQ